MAERAPAAALARALAGTVGGVKIGMEFFFAHGREGYGEVAAAGLPVFLDLKLHDIPNTVARAVAALGPLRPAMLTVHAAGGTEMMRAAARAAAEFEPPRPHVVGVTVLTSLDAVDLAATGVSGAADEQALRLASLAREAGLDGVVCSAQEIGPIRQMCGADFRIVVPGLRPQGAAAGDQKRVTSPRAARQKGADVLVIGRPITAAADPVAAAKEIAASLEEPGSRS